MSNLYESRKKSAGGIEVDSLSITTQPSTTEYLKGDPLDLTGMKETAVFKDGVVADVTVAAETEPEDGNTLNTSGTIAVTAKYGGKTDSTAVSVNPITLSVASMPTKTKFLLGSNLDLSGLSVNGSGGNITRDVTSLISCSPSDGTQLNTTGTQRINVSWRDASTYFDVNVNTRTILKLNNNSSYCPYIINYNNEIYMMGSFNMDSNSYANKMYKFNGTSWVYVADLPHKLFYGDVCVYEGELHLLGGDYSDYGSPQTSIKHYKWNGVQWTALSNFSSDTAYYVESTPKSTYIYDDYMYIMGYKKSSSAKTFKYYKDGTVNILSSGLDAGSTGTRSNKVYWKGKVWYTNAGSSSLTLKYSSPGSEGGSWSEKQVGYNAITNVGSAFLFILNDRLYLIFRREYSSYVCVSVIDYDGSDNTNNIVITSLDPLDSIMNDDNVSSYYFVSGCVFDSGLQDEAFIFLGNSAYSKRKALQFDGTTWTLLSS